MKIFFALLCFIGIFGCSVFFYHLALTQPDYVGLPTVPCLDYTKPVIQDFALTIIISINGKPYSLNPSLGHDYGDCLHDIFVNDASGKVFVKANDAEQFTLGQFFDVWKSTFTPQQIFSYQVDANHHITVNVNGEKVEQYRNIILQPNQTIHIEYQ